MATKARQQYFADEISLQKQRREFSLEDNIKQKIDSVEEWAQVNKIETVKVNWTALTPDANKAVNVPVPNVIDNLYSTSTNDALSAKQWKVLYDYLQNIASRWRFLSNWNSATGLPVTNPTESPYPYKAWDYYSVSNVASGWGTNYRPDGSSYTIWQASTTVETEEVNVSDFYLYDGTNWLLLVNTARQIAVDSSLSTTSTNPVENRVVTNAINAKVWVSADSWNDLLGWAKLRMGSESDFSSIVSPDSNTMYIQYVTSSPTPPSPRQPWANTLVYLPFTEDLLDHSWNGVTFTQWWTNLSIVNWVADFSWWYLYKNASYWLSSLPATVSLWFYARGLSPTLETSIINSHIYIWGYNWRWSVLTNDKEVTLECLPWSAILTNPIDFNKWYYLTYVLKSSGSDLYLNGQKIWTTNSWLVLRDRLAIWTAWWTTSDFWNHLFDGQMSQVIIEDKERTAQEISDYYNQTKWDYWIS